MIEIKLLGDDLFHHTYITKKETRVLDINCDTKNPDFHSSSSNDDFGEPMSRLKQDQFIVVEEFS